MAANWEAIEDALRAWVVSATELPEGSVVWDQQTQVRLTRPYAVLHHEYGDAAGAVDENRTRDNPASTLGDGEELLFETFAHIEFTCRVQIFTDKTNGPDAAGVLAGKCARTLSLETTIDALDLADVALVSVGVVQNLTGLNEGDFEGRAALDVRFRTGDGASQTTTFIETVEATAEVT